METGGREEGEEEKVEGAVIWILEVDSLPPHPPTHLPIHTSLSSSSFQKTANSADENKTKEREISLLFGGESPRQPARAERGKGEKEIGRKTKRRGARGEPGGREGEKCVK